MAARSTVPARSSVENAVSSSLATLIANNSQLRYHQKRVQNKQYAHLKFLKLKQGKRVDSQSQHFVVNAFVKFRDLYPTWSAEQVVKYISEFMGFDEGIIHRILQQEGKNELLKTPGKHQDKSSKQRTIKYDTSVQHAVRRKIHEFYIRQTVPTLKKVLRAIKEDDSIPDIQLNSLQPLLREIGFKFVKNKRNSAVIERDDIVAQRRHYIRQVHSHRSAGKTIYYLDVTWVSTEENFDGELVDTTILSDKDVLLHKSSIGKTQPTSRGRLIIGHCGSEDGFVNNGLLVFKAKKKKTDYQSEMNDANFMKWCENILPNLKRGSTLVINNAPYNSTKLDTVPTYEWRKSDIQDWCVKNNFYFAEDYLKPELLQVGAACKPERVCYKFDTRCSEFGIKVLRLPQYHRNFNPIELVWNQVKSFLRSNNNIHKWDEAEKLLREGINNVTPDHWCNYISHIIEEENKYWELDGLVDTTIDQLTTEDDDSSGMDFSTSDSD